MNYKKLPTMDYRLWTAIFFLCLTANAVQAQSEYSIANMSVELLKSDAVVRNHTIEYEIKSPSKARLYERRVITIFNDESDLNELYVYYDKFRKVENISARLYDAKGKLVRKISKKEIRDYSAISGYSIYEDNRVKYLEVNHSQYPYTVEFEYTINKSGTISHPNWHPQFYDYGVAVQNGSYKITAPKDADIRYQAYNFDPKLEQITEGRNTTYHWQIKNLPPLKEEYYTYHKRDLFPVLKVAPTAFSVDGHSGDMSTWASFGKFIYDINKGRGIPTEKTYQIVQRLTKDLNTDNEKIAALYNYLQTTNRYVSVQLGIGGWQSFDTEYVEKNKYGDCKALSYYMKAMLDAADIEAYPALIYADHRPPQIDENFAVNSFNHMILYVPGDDPTWLECTSTFNTPGYLGNRSENRKVLLITPEGGKLADTPDSTPEHNVGDAKIKVKLSDDGAATIQVRSTKTGAMQRELRYDKNTLSEEKQREKLQEALEELPRFTIDNYEIKPTENKPECELNYDLSVRKLATAQGSRIFIRPNIIHQSRFVPDREDERAQNIIRYNAYTEKDQVTIDLPLGYTAESLPESTDIQSDFGNYKMTCEISGNQLIYNRVFEIKAYNLPAERYQDMFDFYNQVKKSDKAKAVLVKGKNATVKKP